MNGVLDKVSYIIKRQGLGLVIIIVHFKSAGIEKFINGWARLQTFIKAKSRRNLM